MFITALVVVCGIGTDDYICKPFSPREVVARVKAVLRCASAAGITPADDISIDETKYRIRIREKTLETTVVEFQLFKILYGTPGQVWSRGQLMDKIYPDHRIVSDRTIDSHVKKLRKKLPAYCRIRLLFIRYMARVTSLKLSDIY